MKLFLLLFALLSGVAEASASITIEYPDELQSSYVIDSSDKEKTDSDKKTDLCLPVETLFVVMPLPSIAMSQLKSPIFLSQLAPFKPPRL